MTLSEVLDEFDAYDERRNAKAKEINQLCAVWVHQLASLVDLALCDPKHFPQTPAKAFPELFQDVQKSFDWKASKSSWAEYAKLHNAQRGGGA